MFKVFKALAFFVVTHFSVSEYIAQATDFLEEVNARIESIQISPPQPLTYEEYDKLKEINYSINKEKVNFLKSGDIVLIKQNKNKFIYENYIINIYTLPKKENKIDINALSPQFILPEKQEEISSSIHSRLIMECETTKVRILPQFLYFCAYNQLHGGRFYFFNKKTRDVIIEDRHPSTEYKKEEMHDISSDIEELRVFDLSGKDDFLKKDEKAYIGLYHKDGYLGLHYPYKNSFYTVVDNKDLQIKKPRYAGGGVIYYLSDEDSDGLRLWSFNPSSQQKTLMEPPVNKYVSSYGFSLDGSWFYIKVKDLEKGGHQIYEYSGNALSDTKWAKRSKTLEKIKYRQRNPALAIITERDSHQLPKYSLRYSKNGALKTEKIPLYDTHPQDLSIERFSKAIYGRIPSAFEEHTIPVILWLPPAIKEELFPLYVDLHGGPSSEAKLKFNRYVQYWTSRGYAVLEVNYRGSTGFGRGWETALYGHAAGYDADDSYSAVSFLLNRMKRLNRKKIYLGGSSYGAFIAATLISEPEKYPSCFAAVELRCGLYNCANNSEFDDPSPYSATELWLKIYGGNPKENEELNKRISPIEKVTQILSYLPIYISHGAQDKQTLPKQALEYIRKLEDQGKMVSSSYFPESGHDFRKEDERVCLEKIAELFEQSSLQ